MQYPIALVDIACIAVAAACVSSTLSDLNDTPRKLWRLGLSPLLGVAVALLILAGAVVSFQHDATWVATALCGGAAGVWRGRRIAVQTDQVWGTVRTPIVYDALVAAVLILMIATADSLSGLFPRGTLPRHAHMAAASALFAGYLSGRAWSLVRRAMSVPHTDLGQR
jgi:hypothetical protein